jgi:hypothetical protein
MKKCFLCFLAAWLLMIAGAARATPGNEEKYVSKNTVSFDNDFVVKVDFNDFYESGIADKGLCLNLKRIVYGSGSSDVTLNAEIDVEQYNGAKDFYMSGVWSI